MPSAEEHAALIAALLECRAAVVLSGYASPLYDDALTGAYHEFLYRWHGRAYGLSEVASGDGGSVLESPNITTSGSNHGNAHPVSGHQSQPHA